MDFLSYRPPEECEKAVQLMAEKDAVILTYDTETTGLSKTDVPVQVSASKLVRTGKKFVRSEQFDMYIKPVFPMPKGASDVNHITDEMLADKPMESEAFPAIEKYFAGDVIIAGYNVSFDNRMMDELYLRQSGRHFAPEKVIDVMKMAREIVSPADFGHGTAKYTLTNVAAIYGIVEDSMHNSATDVSVTERLLASLYADYQRSRSSLRELFLRPEAQILDTYSFVKSKYVDYLYAVVTVTDHSGVHEGRVYYNKYYNRLCNNKGDVMEHCNVDSLYHQLAKLARSKSGYRKYSR